MLIDEFTWNFLLDHYKIVSKDHEVRRQGIIVNEETGECIVELYLRTILIYPIPNAALKFDNPKTIIISRKENLVDLEKKI